MSVPPGYQLVPGGERPLMKDSKQLGPLDPSAELSVTMLLRPRPGSPPLPDIAHWEQNPPGQRNFLSPDQFTQQYGAARADIDAVTRFAATYGLKVLESHAGRRTVIVRGTAEQMNAAFGVELNQYESPLPARGGNLRSQQGDASSDAAAQTQTHRGFEGAVHLPAELSGVVRAVIGLDNRRLATRAGGTGDPPGAALLTVPQLATVYNFPTTGAPCETIGVFAPTPAAFLRSDINKQYFPSLPKGFQTPPNIVDINLTVDGTTYSNNPSSVQGLSSLTGSLAAVCTELTQDISTSATVAQGANINVYFTVDTEDGWLAFLWRAVMPDPGDNPPSVLFSCFVLTFSDDTGTIGSYTDSGSTAGQMSYAFQVAALRGITVVMPAGDWGADDSTVDGACHTAYPGSDPWVLCCGGTVLSINPGPPPTINSEFVWSDAQNSASVFGPQQPPPDFGATGGGVSDNFPLPSYQASLSPAPTSLNDGGVRRGLPDVAGMVGLGGFFCNAIPYSFVGTSCVAPVYAGLAAVLNRALKQPIGFLNPTLYNNSSVCNDVTFGNNDSGDSPDSPFYSAAAGWDPCSGWGSIDGTRLLTALVKIEEKPLPIFTNNPFNFSYPPGQNFWETAQGTGTDNSTEGLSVGQQNTADNFGNPNSVYDLQNNGDGDGPDVYGDVTLINTAVANNATFASDNLYLGKGSIGLFGRSRGADFSMGVLGQSSKGCAVYGLATDENPITPRCQPSHGIGVVGRSMGGLSPERISVEEIVGQPIGVLGHAATGPGVRGHSGPLLTPPLTEPPLPAVTVASPGGVFSAGRLQTVNIPEARENQQLSLDALPQARLIPSNSAELPVVGNLGDLYVNAVENADTQKVYVNMFLCVLPGTGPKNPAYWAPFTLGAPVKGG
jgi:kumamolisin